MKNKKKQCFQHTSRPFSRNYWFLFVFLKVFLVFKPKNQKNLQFFSFFEGFPMKNQKNIQFFWFFKGFPMKNQKN